MTRAILLTTSTAGTPREYVKAAVPGKPQIRCFALEIRCRNLLCSILPTSMSCLLCILLSRCVFASAAVNALHVPIRQGLTKHSGHDQLTVSREGCLLTHRWQRD